MKQTPLGAILRFMLTMPLDMLATLSRVRPREKTLLLVHMHHIGDYVLARNFMGIMKRHEAYCGYRFTLCANEEIRSLVESFDGDCFDEVIWLNRKQFLSNLCYRFKMLRMIRLKGFAVAVQHAYSREFYFGDAVVRASRSPLRIGSAGGMSNILSWQKTVSDSFYTRLVTVSRGTLFEYVRNREFFEQLLDMTIDLPGPCLDAADISLPVAVDEPFVVIFPGASMPFKCWPPEKFARVAQYLAEKYGVMIVLAGGNGDRERTAQVAGYAGDIPLVDLSGKTSLPQLAAYLQGARLVLSNDSVAVHLAAAVRTPVVTIMTGSHYGRFGPYPQEVFRYTQALFPEGMNNDDDFETVAKRFARISTLSITTVATGAVQAAVDNLMAVKP